MIDDDQLDLSAWVVPPPPDNLADAVIARVRDTTTVSTAVAVEHAAPPRTRWWRVGAAIALASAASVAATLAIAPIRTGGDDDARPASGELFADGQRDIALNGAYGQLSNNTWIMWHRDGDTLVISQPIGAATWRASGRVRILTGAAVAPIEAAGASLRVEAHVMNVSEQRVIGASAVTAAAVALVTAVVYEGHVHVGNLTVPPGTTLELRPNEPPVIAQPPTVAGPPLKVSHASDGLTSDDINGVMRANASAIHACYETALATKPALAGKVVVRFDIDADGHVSNARTASTTLHEVRVEACIIIAIGKLAFPAKGGTAVVNYPFVFSTAECDAHQLAGEGKEALVGGSYAHAIELFERSMICKPDATLDVLAYMAACKGGIANKVTKYHSNLDATQRRQLAPACLANHLDPVTGAPIPSEFDFSKPPANAGYLQVFGKPAAKILIDGADTGRTTPTKLKLTPGKHKITYVIGLDRFTYTITINAGETTTISKDLG
jgi:hypothetical protein